MTEWQPIETAPKDGTLILGFSAQYRTPKLSQDRATIFWDADNVLGAGVGWWGKLPNGLVMTNPTHWMPLPNPPQS